MSLLIEVVRPGKPGRRDTKATRDKCRAGHSLLDPSNIKVTCAVCHRARALQTWRRADARERGLPIPPHERVLCNHDLAVTETLKQCRTCQQASRRAVGFRERSDAKQSQSEK